MSLASSLSRLFGGGREGADGSSNSSSSSNNAGAAGPLVIVNRDCLQLRMIDAKFQPRFRNVSELPVTARLRLFSFDGEQRADLVSLITRGQTTWDLPTLGPGQEAALDIDVQLILANSTVTQVSSDD